MATKSEELRDRIQLLSELAGPEPTSEDRLILDVLLNLNARLGDIEHRIEQIESFIRDTHAL